jgi:hypothetical protein
MPALPNVARVRGAALALLTAVAATVAQPVRAVTARATRTAAVRDEGRLRYISDDATHILDEGPVHGTIPGRARVNFLYNGSPEVTASFRIYAAGGTLTGRARCHLHNPNSPAPSFRGALHITGGSGRYAHARGSGELFGLFYRRGYGLVVQAIGRLRY